MAARILIDDRLLVEELLAGLPVRSADAELSTTAYWYYRACRATALGAGGQLSGPFEQVPADDQAEAAASLLRLRDDIGLPDARATVPAMAALSRRHPRLNLLNLEAVAVAALLGATTWLSTGSAAGVLPSVLDAEGLPWRPIPLP